MNTADPETDRWLASYHASLAALLDGEPNAAISELERRARVMADDALIVRRHVPEWVRRAEENRLVSKDLTNG